jgi:transcription antitermination factor NusG
MIKRETAVLITFGPFAGMNATIVTRRRQRVVVRVNLSRARSILVELDDDMIERKQDSAGHHDRAAAKG